MNDSNVVAQGQALDLMHPKPITEPVPNRQYNTRQVTPAHNNISSATDSPMDGVCRSAETRSFQTSVSPTKSSARKYVCFELILPNSQHKARLPMRVYIYPHDTTDSIITTVKNFYGLYERRVGVAFEDELGTTLIACYENFTDKMTVYVRVTGEEPEMSEYSPEPRQYTSPRRARVEDVYQMLPPATGHPQVSRAASRAVHRQSNSPQPGRGRRSTSASTNPSKSRARPLVKSRGSSSHGSFADGHGDSNNYSDSDGGNGSVTSSRRGRREQVASADISLDNIVEGGRRKRAKFDSSELPLFVPPQLPKTASISSVSPQRRISNHNGASPYYTNQQTFAYPQALPSPVSHSRSDIGYSTSLPTPWSNSSSQAYGPNSRTRNSAPYPNSQFGNGAIVFPTPEPTVGSVFSDEDVARQLMRLGDASNISSHGRHSTSTLDDALSGKAEAATSSEESDYASDDEDHALPPLPYHDTAPMAVGRAAPEAGGETSGDEFEDNKDDSFKSESDELAPDERHGHSHHGNVPRAHSSASIKGQKVVKPRPQPKNKVKTSASVKAPISPASLPQSRKTSSASLNLPQPLAADEEDLSTKPRCQRCRKSKKGCDRQRPCQRCRDAGIGIDGCISEEEGNGRKGRYGRHMGVPVKKAATDLPPVPDHGAPPAANVYPSAFNGAAEKNRKRKR